MSLLLIQNNFIEYSFGCGGFTFLEELIYSWRIYILLGIGGRGGGNKISKISKLNTLYSRVLIYFELCH